MDNNLQIIKMLDLPKCNTKSKINIPIEANVYVQKIISVQTYLDDVEIECMSNKATIQGKIVAKVLYIDKDGMCNIVSEEKKFAETILDNSITQDCTLFYYNPQTSVESSVEASSINLDLDIQMDLKLYINTAVPHQDTNQSGIICRNNEVTALTLKEKFERECSDDIELQLDGEINKILLYELSPEITSISKENGYFVVSGKVSADIIYEDQENVIKKKTIQESFKNEIEANQVTDDSVIECETNVNYAKTNIKTDTNSNSNFVLNYYLIINGVVMCPVNYNFVEDLYSTETELECNFSKREFCQKLTSIEIKESIEGEIELNDINVDDILTITNKKYTFTQTYLKDSKLYVEGIISSSVVFLDEEKRLCSINTDIPFVLSTRMETEYELCNTFLKLYILGCKAKIKRGNVLSLDYDVCVCGDVFVNVNKEILDTIKFGKPISFGDIAFQIFIAKPNETMWDLCKRLKTNQFELEKYNKDMPQTFNGGEKIIVYR